MRKDLVKFATGRGYYGVEGTKDYGLSTTDGDIV